METVMNPEYVWETIYDLQYKKCIDVIVKAIELGSDKAMNNLGDYYMNKGNANKGVEYYEKAAELGNHSAMNNLGTAYLNVYSAYQLASEWYTKSAKYGNIIAMYNLADLHEYYIEDKNKVIEWLTKASELNHMPSMLRLVHKKINSENYTEVMILLNKLKESDYRNKHYIQELIKLCFENTRKLENIYNNIHTDNCSCCYETLKNTNSCVITLLCGHTFHYNCVKKCNKCPMCRHKLKL